MSTPEIPEDATVDELVDRLDEVDAAEAPDVAERLAHELGKDLDGLDATDGATT